MATTPSDAEVRSQAEAVASTAARIPKDFRKQWQLFDDLSSEQIVARVTDDFDDAPAARRDVLTAFLSKRLGYSRFSRRARLTSRPLWDLLAPEVFSTLDEHDRRVVWLIAQTSPRTSYFLHPKAALAAVALWRNGTGKERARAEELLKERGLPTSSEWLYSFVVEMLALDAQEERETLLTLARSQLAAKRYDASALIGGVALVAFLDPWRVGALRPNLIHACDRGAQEYPRKYRPWLDLIADAVVAGSLRSSWMERPFQASIRLAIDDPEREKALRSYYAPRPFETSPARLRQLFAYPLKQVARQDDHTVPFLLKEVERSASAHPARSIHLLELMVEAVTGKTMIEIARTAVDLDPWIEKLIRLYVTAFHLDSHAVALVRRFHKNPLFDDIPAGRFENYLIVCDYDHSFSDRSASVLGSQISHLDKDTAAKVRYFQTGRSHTNSIAKLLASFRGQEDWVLVQLMSAEPVARSVEFVFEEFLELVNDFDFTSQVKRDLKAIGAEIESIDEVVQLPIKNIERALRPQKQKRLIYAALAGAVSGGAGPLTLGLTTAIDTPILLYLAAETCARYCWYYGFDPRENEDILAMILGVALQGASIQSVRFDHVRADLRRMLIRRSIALGAMSNGAALQLIAPTLGELIVPSRGILRGKKDTSRLREFGFPTLVGFSTVAINVSFVYDLCEAARWVLTDRFLARKYPQEWESRF